ncbi:MAG: hypothetical protein HYU66_12430 [Armatimonadetes bacterium]|nr:hypothetical protein [Armatimonadota bacterium]
MGVTCGLVLLVMTTAAPLEFTITPAATGQQTVRVALPLPEGFLHARETLRIRPGATAPGKVGVCALTWYPARPGKPRSARRAMVTFGAQFANSRPAHFAATPVPDPASGELRATVRVDTKQGTVMLLTAGTMLYARPIAPPRTATAPPRVEVVESNAQYRWERVFYPDEVWPRVIELRCDARGGIVAIAHLQNHTPGYGRAPDFGWAVYGKAASLSLDGQPVGETPATHGFAEGKPSEARLQGGKFQFYHPSADLKRRGAIEAQLVDRGLDYRYYACREAERVPMQQGSWRRAELVISPAGFARLTPTLRSPHKLTVDPKLWDQLYGVGLPLDLSAQPELTKLAQFHRDAILHCQLEGDDWGNVSGYNGLTHPASVFGMNRLNHGRSMFEEGWLSGDDRLVDEAVAWCDNFYDQSIWWGDEQRGGTRYNNILAMNQQPPDGDRSYMWRSNSSVSFCTKGFDCFHLAYEETGDPRFLEAREAQAAYTEQHVTAGLNYTRNVGIADDFLHLYRYTGDRRYVDDALKLFRDLRACLSTGDLFTEGGTPIDPDPPFIFDDTGGYQHPFAKPYIIGYALSGLPELSRILPGEPKLRDVVRAVADFMVDSQDPLGGWRYPHPRSQGLILSQAVEHAWQLEQATELLGPDERYLDTIERVLRQQVQGWLQTGQITGGVTPWELKTGKVKTYAELAQLYPKPRDRDPSRDYTEGEMTFGGCPIEALVYFNEVLGWYLQHRPAARLLAPPEPGSPLAIMLAER